MSNDNFQKVFKITNF